MLHLAMFLMDVAIFFLAVRLLSWILPLRPLLYLDRIGAMGVEAVTGTVAHHLRRHCNRPLSQRQEEGLALMALCLTRLILGLAIG